MQHDVVTSKACCLAGFGRPTCGLCAQLAHRQGGLQEHSVPVAIPMPVKEGATRVRMLPASVTTTCSIFPITAGSHSACKQAIKMSSSTLITRSDDCKQTDRGKATQGKAGKVESYPLLLHLQVEIEALGLADLCAPPGHAHTNKVLTHLGLLHIETHLCFLGGLQQCSTFVGQHDSSVYCPGEAASPFGPDQGRHFCTQNSCITAAKEASHVSLLSRGTA